MNLVQSAIKAANGDIPEPEVNNTLSRNQQIILSLLPLLLIAAIYIGPMIWSKDTGDKRELEALKQQQQKDRDEATLKALQDININIKDLNKSMEDLKVKTAFKMGAGQ